MDSRTCQSCGSNTLAATPESKGFQRTKSDPNLYFHAKRKIYLLCYVDDLMLFGEQKAVAGLIADLQKELLLRVTGELSEGQPRGLNVP